jgi:hypothetical protein
LAIYYAAIWAVVMAPFRQLFGQAECGVRVMEDGGWIIGDGWMDSVAMSMKVNFHTARARSCDRVLVPKLEKEWS